MTQKLMADIYSLALIVFEVVVEEEPFEDLNVRQLVANVGHGKIRPTSAGVKLSQPVLDLLNNSWDGSAPKRPTADGFKEKWTKSVNCSGLYNLIFVTYFVLCYFVGCVYVQCWHVYAKY